MSNDRTMSDQVPDDVLDRMLAKRTTLRTPTVDEWYGERQPSFPDDDGEEMRRASSMTEVVEVQADKLRRIVTELRELRELRATRKEKANG